MLYSKFELSHLRFSHYFEQMKIKKNERREKEIIKTTSVMDIHSVEHLRGRQIFLFIYLVFSDFISLFF